MLYSCGYGSVEYRHVENSFTVEFSKEPVLPTKPMHIIICSCRSMPSVTFSRVGTLLDDMQIWATAAAFAALMTLTNGAYGSPTTIEGELITVMCFVGKGEKGRGADHAACALKCATEGYPLAIVTKQGEMYKVVGKLTADKNVALRGLLAQAVVATGEVGEERAGKTIDAMAIVAAVPPNNSQ